MLAQKLVPLFLYLVSGLKLAVLVQLLLFQMIQVELDQMPLFLYLVSSLELAVLVQFLVSGVVMLAQKLVPLFLDLGLSG